MRERGRREFGEEGAVVWGDCWKMRAAPHIEWALLCVYDITGGERYV